MLKNAHEFRPRPGKERKSRTLLYLLIQSTSLPQSLANRTQVITPLPLRVRNVLHRRRIGPEPQLPVLVPTSPSLPRRRARPPESIRVLGADETGPVPLHHRHNRRIHASGHVALGRAV